MAVCEEQIFQIAYYGVICDEQLFQIAYYGDFCQEYTFQIAYYGVICDEQLFLLWNLESLWLSMNHRCYELDRCCGLVVAGLRVSEIAIYWSQWHSFGSSCSILHCGSSLLPNYLTCWCRKF